MLKTSDRGRIRSFPSISLDPYTTIVTRGRFLRMAEIFDEFWIRSDQLLALPEVIARLQSLPGRPDLLTSMQKLPHIRPLFPYPFEWDNLAVASFGSYAEWFETQIDRSARKQIKQAAKAGIRAETVPFDDNLVCGICSIYNETPVRQGKKFWHYGKDHETVKAENGTYLERSAFIGAYYENELVGFIKIVFDGEVASLMQILSKSSFFAKRPNNALLSQAVEVCVQRGAKCLTYGQLVYGKKEQSSLVDFKKGLGFKRVDVPRYYVPLTVRGRAARSLNLHKGLSYFIPSSWAAAYIRLRGQLYRGHRKP